jgi:hypothetical protein
VLHDPLAESGRQHLDIIPIDPRLRSDLLAGEVQPHESETQDPDLQRLMVPGQDRVGQVVEPLAAALALVALGLALGVVVAVLGDLGTTASGASHAVGPAHRADGLEAPDVADEGLDVDHRQGTTGVPGDPSPSSVLVAESLPETGASESPRRNPG